MRKFWVKYKGQIIAEGIQFSSGACVVADLNGGDLTFPADFPAVFGLHGIEHYEKIEDISDIVEIVWEINDFWNLLHRIFKRYL